jgi:hypothetical protein
MGKGLAILGVPGVMGRKAWWQTFDPTSVGALGLWIDAAHPASLFQDSAGTIPAVADGDPIGRAGRVATNLATQSTTANKPTLKLNIQNGKPVIRFDSDDYLSLANLALLNNVGSVSFFAVLRYPDLDTIRCELFYSVGTSAAPSRFTTNMADATDLLGMAGRRLDTDSIQTIRANSDFNTTLKSVFCSYATQTVDVRKNGASIASSSTFQTAGNTSATDSLCALVGAATDPISQFFNGDLMEMLLYVPALSDANRDLVEAYLNAKWAVY